MTGSCTSSTASVGSPVSFLISRVTCFICGKTYLSNGFFFLSLQLCQNSLKLWPISVGGLTPPSTFLTVVYCSHSGVCLSTWTRRAPVCVSVSVCDSGLWFFCVFFVILDSSLNSAVIWYVNTGSCAIAPSVLSWEQGGNLTCV